ALAYKPRSGDVFVVSYSKCGTTWTQYIVHAIVDEGRPPKSYVEFALRSPFLELMGAESALKMPGPGAIKTHFPFHLQPYSTKAKYIYVTRNPYDCCVSYYHHVKGSPVYQYGEVEFEDFFSAFLSGKVSGGDYFHHLLSWYERRKDPNVLLLIYEDLISDTAAQVLKIATFLNEEYGRKLRGNDGALLQKIVEMTSFENMRNKALTSMEVYRRVDSNGHVKPVKGNFFRKGTIGDWKNHFTAEQTERMKRRIAEKSRGSDVMQLWRDFGLP
ncbi:unnamed protein product, partial [Ixodes hexagonus]